MSIVVTNSIIVTSTTSSLQPPTQSRVHCTVEAANSHGQTAPPSASQLEEQLQDALQKTGIKAEIEYKANGHMVFRYVDEDTQLVEFQIPTETVLSLIASLNEASRNRDSLGPGAFINEQA